MSDKLNDAPPLAAPKTGKDYLHFPALPEDGPVVMTLTASNFIKNYERIDPTTNETVVYDAIELIWGAKVDGKCYFVKTWPAKYSSHEKSNYAKIVKALTGSLPAAGDRPSNYYGKAALVTVENKQKTSKKGTAYTSSGITGYSAVPKTLAGTVTALAELKPALEAAIADNSKKGDDPF